MSLRWTKNNRCYTKYRMKNLCNSYIKLQQSCRQHKLWLKPDSTPNYSSNRRSQFSCMLSIAKYSSMPNKKWRSPGNIHYCKRCTLKHYYSSHTMLILLNKQCKLWLKPDSIPNYRLNKHQLSDYRQNSLQYLNKLGMKFKWLDNIHYCRKYKLLSSDCMCCNL